MSETTKRCWVIVEGWDRTGPLQGVRDTYEAAVLTAANTCVGQQFRVVQSHVYDYSGLTRLEEPLLGRRASIWEADLRFLPDAKE
jgi:hypothetical protein